MTPDTELTHRNDLVESRVLTGELSATPTGALLQLDRKAEPTYRPRELAKLASESYVEGSLLYRKLQHWRPYICPFENLLSFVPRNADVLDVGCGGGLFLALLAASRKSLRRGIGFDCSAQAITIARQMATNLKTKRGIDVLEFQHLSVTDPWPAGDFDVVSVIDVMHHVPPDAHRDVLSFACEKVASGGLLLYKDMCSRPFWRAWANRLHDLAMAGQWIHYLATDDVVRWVLERKMELIHNERINRLWYGHDLLVFRKTR